MKRGSFSCPGGESGAACPIVKIEPTPALEKAIRSTVVEIVPGPLQTNLFQACPLGGWR